LTSKSKSGNNSSGTSITGPQSHHDTHDGLFIPESIQSEPNTYGKRRVKWKGYRTTSLELPKRSMGNIQNWHWDQMVTEFEVRERQRSVHRRERERQDAEYKASLSRLSTGKAHTLLESNDGEEFADDALGDAERRRQYAAASKRRRGECVCDRREGKGRCSVCH
jgi:hypothetical protein